MRVAKMNAQQWTGIFLFGVLIAVGVYDVVAGALGGHRATVSFVVQAWSQQYPVLTLLAGIVIGHLFWPVAPDRLPVPIHQPPPLN